VDFSTGSLGHGLSYGAGSALAARLDGSARRVFVLLSDAELNEGSTWEAVMFAAHHKLGALTAIVDANGQQAFGHTHEVLDLEPIAARFSAFGWDACDVDGHDISALANACAEQDGSRRMPRVVIARTVAGKGVSFMQGIAWHYLPMTAEQYRSACAEVEGDIS
jgi:transketolase